MSAAPRALAIDGSLGGTEGSSAVLLEDAIALLGPSAEIERVCLARVPGFAAHRDAIARAEAILIATGTYWDSWSSHLQRFLEEATVSEGSDLWLGKPAAVIVTAHSVGGKGVLSRLQGVLVTLGALIPPMSGVVITLASEQARVASEHAEDLWSRDDLEIVAHNLLEAARGGRAYRSWPVDRGDPRRRWLAPRR